MPSEKEKMLAGQLYNASDPQLATERKQTRSLLYRLNTSEYGDSDKYSNIISQLLPHCDSDIWIEPPFFAIMVIIFLLVIRSLSILIV
jgi:maltose O-acetyltransferase